MSDLRPRAVPLVGVDRVDVLSSTELRAYKRITAEDAYLEGHYPDFTIYPGVFIIDSVRQAVAVLVERTHGEGADVELVAVKSVRFTAPLLPGHELSMSCSGRWVGREFTVTADCRNGEAKAARMSLVFRLVEESR